MFRPMTYLSFYLCLSILAVLCSSANAGEARSVEEQEQSEFDELVTMFSDNYRELGLPALELSFVANIQALGTEADLRHQQAVFESLLLRLEQVDTGNLDVCRKIEMSIMRSESTFGLQRAQLGLKFLAANPDIAGASSLSDITMGSDWYQFFLSRWNGAQLEPDQVFAFGEQQLSRSVAAFNSTQAAMGFEGDDAGLADYLTRAQSRIDGGQASLDLFDKIQEKVWSNLANQFPRGYAVKPARIKRSDRGESFPVPGYCDIAENTFYYNLVSKGFWKWQIAKLPG